MSGSELAAMCRDAWRPGPDVECARGMFGEAGAWAVAHAMREVRRDIDVTAKIMADLVVAHDRRWNKLFDTLPAHDPGVLGRRVVAAFKAARAAWRETT